MSISLMLGALAVYLLCLYAIAYFSTRKMSSQNLGAYFSANKQAPWLAVAAGMIGSSISGVTFISVPGNVGIPVTAGTETLRQMGYMQMVLGNLAGFVFIAFILLPLYYRLRLTSIYSYLGKRFGAEAQKTGAGFFILSRSLGSAVRLFLALSLFQTLFLNQFGVPFWLTSVATLFFIMLYTGKGGLKTVIWTDVFQTVLFLGAAAAAFYYLSADLRIENPVQTLSNSRYGQIFFWDWNLPNHFVKQFLSGALLAVAMTGLDQDMMQKNLSINTLGNAQRNLLTYSATLVAVNLLFVGLGALLYLYADSLTPKFEAKPDQLFAAIAVSHFPPLLGVAVLLGLIAAAFSSVDGSLTALTTALCIDVFEIEKMEDARALRLRRWTHRAMAALFVVLLLFFHFIIEANPKTNVVSLVFKMAAYTYGPLLGLFAFGMLTRYAVRRRYVLAVCAASPALCLGLAATSEKYWGGYVFGDELILINACLTFAGLFFIRTKSDPYLPETK